MPRNTGTRQQITPDTGQRAVLYLAIFISLFLSLFLPVSLHSLSLSFCPPLASCILFYTFFAFFSPPPSVLLPLSSSLSPIPLSPPPSLLLPLSHIPLSSYCLFSSLSPSLPPPPSPPYPPLLLLSLLLSLLLPLSSSCLSSSLPLSLLLPSL